MGHRPRLARCAAQCMGVLQKLAVADRAAVVVDAVFANPAAYDRTQLLLGSVLFTVQLYADFSGYTDIVLGVGEVLGLTLPENFRQPSLRIQSRISGRGGISASPAGCGIMSISHWAAALHQSTKGPQPAAYLFGQRPVARCRVDLPCLGWAARPVSGGGKSPPASVRRAYPACLAHGRGLRCSGGGVCHLPLQQS